MSYNNYGGYDQGGGGYDNNYSTTSYGAQGGNEGGGFLAGSQGEKKVNRDKESLRPLTIRQIHQAEEIHTGGETILEGHELSRVHVVGQVRSITKVTTNTLYKLDDGTGTVEARVWTDTDAPTHDEFGNPLVPNPETVIQTGEWVRVMGLVKFLQGKRFVTVSNMKKVKDMNEISYHLLEAVYVHLYLAKGPPEALGESQNGATNGDGGAMQGVQSGYGGQQGNAVGDSRLGNVSAIARKVYARLQQDSGNEGVHLDLVARELGLQYAQVKKAAEELNEDSKIFTTVDDDTYAVLED